MRKNRRVLYVISFIYNMIFSPNIIKFYFSNKVTIKGAFLKRVKIKNGNGGRIYIGPKSMLDNCLISVYGNDSLLHIEGTGSNIHKSRFYAGLRNGKIIIDEGFTCEGAIFRAHEGKTIQIGKDCMFSDGIDISTTDFHSIISLEDSSRINIAKDITLGEHIWVGRNVTILKGTFIPDNIIIGFGSTVTGNIKDKNAIYAGIPARKIKSNITWSRPLI